MHLGVPLRKVPELSDRGAQFRLYVVGRNQARQLGALAASALEALFQKEFSLEVIDLVERPELAEKDNIIATPLLVRLRPIPKRYVVGALTNVEKLRQILM